MTNPKPVQTSVPVQVGEPKVPTTAVNVNAGDWRSQFQAEQRRKVIQNIVETLKKLFPMPGQDGREEIERIALKFENKIYSEAPSQLDYLRRICLKMHGMEKSQTSVVNPLQYNSGNMGKNPIDPAINDRQSQVHNQEQPLFLPNTNHSQKQQQLLHQENMTSNGVPNVVGQNLSLQNIPNVSNVAQNSVANPVGPGMPSNPFGNSQRQMQPSQLAFPQQQQQQSQNPQQYPYQKQLQDQIVKQKYQWGSMGNSPKQSDIQLQQQQQEEQPSSMQLCPRLILQQNLPSSVQQSTEPVLEQCPHPMRQLQQQQPQQDHVNPLQQSSITRKAMLATQKQQQRQQHMIRQQRHRTMQQNQIIQPNITFDMRQQQISERKWVTDQKNNMSDLQQQQLIDQHAYSPDMNQLQVVGTQISTSGMESNQQATHVTEQSKIPIQQKLQQTSVTLLPTQDQQSQPQQQLVSEIQTLQLVGLQQQTIPLQRDIYERLQTSSMSDQQQTLVEQPKQLSQSQQLLPDISSSSLVSSSLKGSVNGGEWQEEVYQKIKTMKEMHFAELAELYKKISAFIKQYDSLPQQPNDEQLRNAKYYKGIVERLLNFLRLNKDQIRPVDGERVGTSEKCIIRMLHSNRIRNTVSSLQGGHHRQPGMHAPQHKQLPESQNSQMQPHENEVNPQMQSVNRKAPAIEVQQNNWINTQHNSISSVSNISSLQDHMINRPQPSSSLDPAQGDAQNLLQHVTVASLQHNLVSSSQELNTGPSSLGSLVNTAQLNLNTLQPNSNLIQHLKEKDGQMSQSQQLKLALSQAQMHQQLSDKQQQQQQHTLLLADEMSGLHSACQLTSLYCRQPKTGTSFPVSAVQGLPSEPSEISQHSSLAIDQKNLLKSSVVQSSRSTVIVPSPSIPLAPSPMPGDSEKVDTGVESLPHAGISRHLQTTQSLAIGNPGISASPLLADFTIAEATLSSASTIVSDQPVLEQPHERLMRLVKSMSARALSASISDISSVVDVVDRIAGSSPSNGSRAAVGEDLVAMTNCRLQAGNANTSYRPSGARKMKRYTSGMWSNAFSSSGSLNNCVGHLNGSRPSELKSTATSCMKRLRVEANNALVEEVREINQQLIDSVVDISHEECGPRSVAAAADGCKGAIVKCSFCPVALRPNLNLPHSSVQLPPIQPLQLLIPNNYPNCSPIFLDNFPVEISSGSEDLSMKAKTRFSRSLRCLSHPMSLGEMARTWDVCARAVISEYAQQSGGGSFSSKYGTWQSLNAA